MSPLDFEYAHAESPTRT